MTSVEGSGFKQLEIIAARLRVAGDGRLKTRLRASVRAATAPLINDVRQAARDSLPKKGGLNEWVASGRFTTSTRLAASTVGVSIVRKGQIDGRAETFRHPVFGHRDWPWKVQKMDVSWFYTTLARKAPEKAIPAIERAFESVALEITKGV